MEERNRGKLCEGERSDEWGIWLMDGAADCTSRNSKDLRMLFMSCLIDLPLSGRFS